jgi:putative NADPH-quinone reductase
MATLRSSGHSVRIADLYAAQFEPSLSRLELEQHRVPVEGKDADTVHDLAEYSADLTWCDALVLVYPTWC